MIPLLTEEQKRANRKELARKAGHLDQLHSRFWGRGRRRRGGPAGGVHVRALEAVAVKAGPDSVAVGYLAIVEVRRAA